jgi:hypothetical protein
MTKAFDDYTLLAGSHGARGSLWQGPDHLLVVDGRGWLLSFAELYRRVDYANIQSLTLVRTRSYFWLALAWGSAALVFLLFTMLALSQQLYALITLGSLTAGLLAGFVIHLMRGPTCACALQTNVQVLRLRSLNRLRTAKPAMQQIAQLCRQRQGSMAPEDMVSAPAHETKPLIAPQPMAGIKPPWRGSRWVTATGWVIFLWGATVMAELFIPGVPFAVLDAVLGMSALALSIVSLAIGLRMQMPGGVAGVLWASVAMELLTAGALFIMATVARAQQRGSGIRISSGDIDTEEFTASVANLSFQDAGVWAWGVVGIGAVLSTLGLLMVVLGGAKKGQAPATESPAVPPPPASQPPEEGHSAP